MNVSLYENRSVVERMRGLRDLRLARRAVCSGVVCGAKPGVCRSGEEGVGCCPCRRPGAGGEVRAGALPGRACVPGRGERERVLSVRADAEPDEVDAAVRG